MIDRDIERYNNIVGKIEYCANDIIDIFVNSKEEDYDVFRDICYRLSIFLLEK